MILYLIHDMIKFLYIIKKIREECNFMTRKSTVLKECQHCKEVKSLSDFYRNKTKADGHNGICIQCQKLSNKKNNK